MPGVCTSSPTAQTRPTDAPAHGSSASCSKGRFGLTDYEKIFCPDPKADDIFDLRAVDRETGCIVVVRPDQYVSHVLPLDGHAALGEFFAGILIAAG